VSKRTRHLQPDPREEDLFSQALSLTSAERRGWLDRTCGGEKGLRERVEALLRAHEEAGDLLDRPGKSEAFNPDS
jgi:eukaryotic-like serine/threonine-protein kinase